MKIFLSYPHTQKEIAEDLVARLRAEGHTVFHDSSSLPASESYDDKIRRQIIECELFISLVKGDSLREGTYSRSELKLVEEKWPNPSGRVLPVALDAAAMQAMPAYLLSVTILQPVGQPVADVLSEVEKIASRPRKQVARAGRVAAGVAALAGLAWLIQLAWPDHPIDLLLNVGGEFYEESASAGQLGLEPATRYLRYLAGGEGGTSLLSGELLDEYLAQDISDTEPWKREAGTDWDPFPHLRVAMANNSDKTVLVDRVKFLVASSEADLRPLPYGSRYGGRPGRGNGGFSLGNAGWGSMRDVVFRYDLVTTNQLAEAGTRSTRAYEWIIPEIPSDEHAERDIWDELEALGADIAYLKGEAEPDSMILDEQRLHRDAAAVIDLLGGEPYDSLHAVGELQYSWGNGQSTALQLEQKIVIYEEPRAGAFLDEPSAVYFMDLQPRGMNYEVERQVAHSLQPGEQDFIELRLWCDMSSFHELTVMVHVDEQWVEAGDRVSVHYYQPAGTYWEDYRAETEAAQN